MESASESSESRGVGADLQSPTIIITLILITVFVVVASVVGDYASPITIGLKNGNLLVLLLTQCDVPTPIFPWTVLTAIFLHENILDRKSTRLNSSHSQISYAVFC